MKTITQSYFVCYLIWSSFSAYADATVHLSSYDSHMPVLFQNSETLAAGPDFYVEVLGGPVGGYLAPLEPIGASTPIIKLNDPGYFDAGIGVIPGVRDGGVADFQVRAWYGSPDYDHAAAGVGLSIRWTQIVGGWDPTSGVAPTGPTLQMGSPVWVGFPIPEPSVMGLAILGAGLIAVAFRQKQLPKTTRNMFISPENNS